jgi:GAF domain-containing protein
VSARKRGYWIPLGAEIALAFLLGLAAFTVASVVIEPTKSDVLVVLIGVAGTVAVVAIARYWGIAYAVPVALAALIAFDWFRVPPTHPFAFPDTSDLLELFSYLAFGVLVGEVAARALRRADVFEVARSDLAEEQAALRRVATLVAQGEPPDAVFAAVAEEAGVLLGVDGARIVRYMSDDEIVQLQGWTAPGTDPLPVGVRRLDQRSLSARVLRTGRAARMDDHDDESEASRALGEFGIRSAVSTPIVIEGRLWGAMGVVSRRRGALLDDAERRLIAFTGLVATAISNTDSREELARLADEQAALRRVATLVARREPSTEIFAAVAQELGQLLEVDLTHMGRYESDGTGLTVAQWTKGGEEPTFERRIPASGESVSARLWQTGRAVRVNSYEGSSSEPAVASRAFGLRSSVGVPIEVEGRLWGVMAVASRSEEPLPADTERKTAAFTELIATAIANSEAQAELARLAEARDALRRVATLVAHEASPAEVFAEVADGARRLLGVEDTIMFRYESDGTVTLLADAGISSGAGIAVGSRIPVAGNNVTATIQRTGRAVRIDDYATATGVIAAESHERGIRAAVGTPIVVEGRLWGAVIGATRQTEPMPPDTESRIGEFTELIATAIANAEARAEVRRLAEEQAALRRVATLVARRASPAAVFEAVATEMGRVLDADRVALCRYEADGVFTVVADRGDVGKAVPVGTRVPLDGASVSREVLRTERPARVNDWEDETGPVASIVRDVGMRSTVGVPLLVEGELWGVIMTNWQRSHPPADTENRMMEFAELVDTAIANADGRAQLTASRARLVGAGDEARRHVVRDLHDGAQQRLVHTIVTLKLAQRSLRKGDGTTESLVAEALTQAEGANAELRDLAHGIHPSVLTHGGLRAGVDAIAARLDVPVTVDVPADRFPAGIEASAYFVVAEALTNVVKHSRAKRARVEATSDGGALRVEIRDDGVGGADPDGGGLVGLDDRVAALGGQMRIDSQPGDGTLIAATLPLPV